MITKYTIDPQPVVKETSDSWDVSGLRYPKAFKANYLELIIGGDVRFAPPLEVCNGSYDNIKESWVEFLDGAWTWIIVL